MANETPTFTPGPWKFAADSYAGVNRSRKYDCVYRGNGSTDQPLVTIAQRIPRSADTRLIAAAPALYEALISLLKAYGASDGRNGNSGECWDLARAARKLVEGEDA